MLRPVILVAGTNAGNPSWIEDPLHPFQRMLEAEGLVGARHPLTHLPFRWSTKLSGLLWIHRGLWEREAALLEDFIRATGAVDLILHSHGGQLGIWAAAALAGERRLRTFTTVGTPHRTDVPVEAAAANIDYWQHVYDIEKDWIAGVKRPLRKLGQLGDWSFKSRTFDVPGVVNVGLREIRHSRILDARGIHVWHDEGLAAAIRIGPDQPRDPGATL